jgi:pyruvate,water dikinase
MAAPARDWVGNQAFYLSQLQQQGLPVLPSLVITTPAFQAFIESIDWLEPLFADLPNSSLHIDADNPQQLQAIAQQIREEIFATELTAAWLSELEAAIATLPTSTLLLRPSLAVKPGAAVNLPPDAINLLDLQICPTQPAAIATALKSLWIEPFRAKSLLYWQRQAIPLEKLTAGCKRLGG